MNRFLHFAKESPRLEVEKTKGPFSCFLASFSTEASSDWRERKLKGFLVEMQSGYYNLILINIYAWCSVVNIVGIHFKI